MKLTIDFAFAGFDIIKKNPMAVLLWGLVYLVVSLVATVIVVLAAGTSIAALQTFEHSPPSDPTIALQYVGALVPAGILAVVLSILASAIIQCAVYRSQLQPNAKGFGFMQLGGHEVRQIIVSILWALAFIVFYVMFIIAVAILMAIAGFVVQANGVVGGILMFVLGVAAVVAFLYVLSRWSLALIQSFAEEKINVFGSFKLTKGNGWTLMGGYILLIIVAVILMTIVYGVLFGVALGMGMGFTDASKQLMQPDMSSLPALFTGIFGLQIIISALLSGVYYALFYGASVAAYKTLTAQQPRATDVI